MPSFRSLPKAHFALNVRNLERSLEFYRKMFGMEPYKVQPGYAKFDLDQPPLNFTLNEASFTERGALSHLGIQVETADEVAATRSRWIAAGLYTKDEIETDCCYALQTKTWVFDPDGNEWEVFVVLADQPAAEPKCDCTNASASSLVAILPSS